MSERMMPPAVAVVHLTTVEYHHVDGLVLGDAQVISLDHQANQEVCEALQRMFSRASITATREDQS